MLQIVAYNQDESLQKGYIINQREEELSRADDIRDFAFKEIIEPARKQGKHTVTIRAGDVHRDMGLYDRMPAVCSALGSKKFEDRFNVKRLKMEGPLQGANALFTFEI